MQEMVHTADVVIIGGGCMGTSIAYHLAKRGIRDVVLVEKNFLASGATGKSSAIIRMHYSTETLAKMALYSFRIFQNFADAVGGNAGFVQAGFLVGVGPQSVEALKGSIALQQGVGVNTRFVSPQEMKEIEPTLRVEDFGGGAYEPDSGYADPSGTTVSFARRARELGATILQGTLVTDILLQGGKVRGVRTSRGDISAPTVVLATGVWSPKLGEKIGVEFPIVSCRSKVLAVKRPPEFTPAPKVFVDFVHQMYYRPETGELSLVGSIDPREAEDRIDPDAYSDDLTFETMEEYFGKACLRYPILERGYYKGGWAGPYDVTPDWHPILDALPGFEGLYCAVGFSGHGFKLSPAIGEMMARLITEGKCTEPADISLFRFNRYAEGRLIQARYGYTVIG
ncbi:MAG: FAD-binding oxidoreductase [Nitrospinota bacterium]|nr:MAG: FAD-binding oxidoreductase [Nitrospinota bacterium]